MASGNGLLSSSALVGKRPCALGPFPRYIWIHQDTPQDSLDKTCHEIWKRVQGLPEASQPWTSMEQLSVPMAGTIGDHELSFQEEVKSRGAVLIVSRMPSGAQDTSQLMRDALYPSPISSYGAGQQHCSDIFHGSACPLAPWPSVWRKTMVMNSNSPVPFEVDGEEEEEEGDLKLETVDWQPLYSDCSQGTQPGKALELSSDKDEISLLVEQEFLSLTKEHSILVKESSEELEAPGSSLKGTRELAPCILAPPVVADGNECPRASIIVGNKLPKQKVATSINGSRQDCDSAMSAVKDILHATKVKSHKGTDDRDLILGASNLEVSKLLAQLPLKSTEASKTPDNKKVLEETRVIKDFLQNNMFSGPGLREPMGLSPFLLPPPSPPLAPPDKLPELLAQKRQLPVFAKICSKPEADPAVERHHLLEWSPGTKEPTKGRESLFLSQWPQSQKNTCGEEGCCDPMGTASLPLPPKKPACPVKKNLLYELFGATKNPSRQMKLRNKVEVDGLELKVNPPVTVADKNNLKHTGNVFTPHFATALTSATLNQPFWLNLNYPPPPVFPNPSTFLQYQVPIPSPGRESSRLIVEMRSQIRFTESSVVEGLRDMKYKVPNTEELQRPLGYLA
ncbi:hypothetical protein P7K49_015934 [Saguinus oedipus]|uniref:Uncharacterized protein n=1 Tax=Saguinus oedipus TaxID=9490 RepID=A0ABQ9VB78_SAGOE|nr:hypothetical protein P7K49_015934 [Saguinus oedipus]